VENLIGEIDPEGGGTILQDGIISF
jgi:hypothetical protein